MAFNFNESSLSAIHRKEFIKEKGEDLKIRINMQLFYKDVCLGLVTEVGRNFPSYYGVFAPDISAIEKLDRPVRNSIRISLKEISEDDLSEEEFEELLAWVLKTEDWKLKWDNKEVSILPPNIGDVTEKIGKSTYYFFSWR